MIYCAIIGDIIDSKKIVDRSLVQDKLNNVLINTNDKYKEYIASSFTITLGDEFQGLLFRAVKAFDVIEYIQRNMHPVRLRFGIGLDDIFTEINPDLSIGADGPAFYSARNMISDIRAKQNSLWSYQPEIFFKSQSCNDELINATAILYRQLERNWTETQRKYIYYYFDYTNNQYSIAEHFNVKQPNIFKAFDRAGLYKYIFALEQLNKYFEKNNF